MDKLTIFNSASTEVSIKSNENNTIDSVVNELSKIIDELKLTRAGHEEWTWGNLVEDSEIDTEEVLNG